MEGTLSVQKCREHRNEPTGSFFELSQETINFCQRSHRHLPIIQLVHGDAEDDDDDDDDEDDDNDNDDEEKEDDGDDENDDDDLLGYSNNSSSSRR